MAKKQSQRVPSPQQPSDARAQVLYDGECAMCSNLALRINATDAKQKLATTNLHRASLPEGVTEDAVRHELHVVESDGTITRGPDAVLRILEEYPRWRRLARVGRWRILRPFMQVGYRFVAANREHIFGSGARLFWSKTIVVVGLVAGVAMSPRLWISARAYPLVPVFGDVPAVVEYVALAAMLLGAALSAVAPKPRGLMLALLGGAAVLALGDQTRWQPWFYQYAVMLGILAAWRWKRSDIKASLEAQGALRAVLVGTYCWSGIQKLNRTYLDGTFGWLLEPLEGVLPDSLLASLSSLGVGTPVLEVAIGIGLLFPATRRAAVIAAVAMHALLLAMLGPWAHDWNSVVWPWNAAMIALVIVLFGRDRDAKAASIVGRPMSISRAMAVAAFIVLPALSLIDRWDPYLSSSLYSRNIRNAGILLRSDARLALPDDLQPYADEEDVMWPMTWALDELNVPANPAARIYKGLAREICSVLPDPSGLILSMSSKPDVLTGESSVTEYGCDEL